nr:gliding motility-associated C-terminal domain-containing protein [Prolixibacteraceae bacterium]
GDSLTYFIDVSNYGPSNAHNIQVVDELPDELSFVNANNGGYFFDGFIFWDVDSIVANTTLRLSLEVAVNNDVETDSSIRNIAFTYKPESEEPEGTDTSIVVVGYNYELLITKTASDTAVFAGDEIDYIVSILNNGDMDLYDIHVEDTLQGNVAFISASHEALNTDGVIKWDIPEIKAGELIDLMVTVKVDEETENGTLIYNVAWLSDNYTEDPNSSDTTAVEVISETVNNDPELFVSKTTTSSQAQIGDTIEYIIEVSNIGSDEAHNVLILDNLPDELTFVSASDGGQLIDDYIVEWLIGNLNEGQSKVVQVSALLNENAEEGSVVANYAVTSGDNRDTIVVDSPALIDVGEGIEIVANDDYSHIDYFFEGTAIFNILENDSLNGYVATLTDVEVTITNEAGNSDISLAENTGEVIISGTVPTGIYQITYRICERANPDNCDNAVITIEIIDNCEMIIPDGFSPNGDGVGDYFRITCIDRYPDAKIEIFNRWGNMVYSKENYGNIEMWGDQDAWWDGYSQNTFDLSNDLLPVGTYFYILRIDDIQKPKTGSIFLNR